MSYVKNYNVGQINIDLLNTISLDDSPFVQYTHELPLLSFGDVQHNMNLSLVFNYERYREEKASGKNPFFIAPGFKLNLQKRLIYDKSNLLTAFQDEDGRNINLKAFGNTYTFNDESQRILRNTQSILTVENPDLSKETYNSNEKITGVYDKYNNPIFSYAYNNAGHFKYIIFKGSKKMTFDYVLNRIDSITYDDKTISFYYNTDGTLNYIQHYTGVNYTFTMSKPSFSAYDVNFECKATATEGITTVSYSKKLELVGDSENEVYNVNIFDKNGSDTVNTVTYRYPRSIMYPDEPRYVDIINNNGVETRVQIFDHKVLCSYEVQNGEPQFEVKPTDAYSRYLGNVTLYNGTVASLNNRDSGVQTINDGLLMNYYTYDNLHCWSSDIVDASERKGYYTISGWIKSNVDYVNSEEIYIGNTSATNNSYVIPIEPNKKWQYFSITVYIEANTIYLSTAKTIQKVSLRDVRLTYQRPDDLAKGNLYNTAMSDYVLLNGNEEIAFNEANFHYSANGIDDEIKSADGESKVVTFSDVMRYKLRKKREAESGEIYYNNCKNIITGTTNFKITVGEDEDTEECFNINDLDIGIRVCSKGQKTLTRYSINENNQSSNIVKTCTVTKKSEETTVTGVVSTEILNNNLDVISSTVDNVTTLYERDSQGLVTRQSVSGLYIHDTTFTDTLITVNDVNPGTGSTIATTKYHIDSTWGGITKIEMPDGTVITDTYDGDMSTLTGRTFGNATARQHAFEYSKGRLSSITSGTINYGFGYDTNTGDVASVNKNGEDIEEHTYGISNGETTVNSNYPSSGNALFTESKVLDKYGRLKSIDGILVASYDLNPYWYYFDSDNHHTTMESYSRATHGELNQITKGVDCKGALLSQITDSLASEVTRYGYDSGKLTATVTKDVTNVLRRQETFVYDNADRVTRNRFDHNLATNEYVISDIGYVKSASDPTADSRVSNYSYKINGTEKAKTANTYDTYKRVTKKTYTVGGKVFTKSIQYDKTKVNKVVDSVGGTAQFEYDSMGRISKETDSSGNILKSYTYDSYGQLIRENNAALDKTFVYEYDNIGNVVRLKTYDYTTGSLGAVISQQNFVYDTTHPDRLTSCGGTSISYNGIGCPTTYDGYTASWTRGKLSKLTKGSRRSEIHNYYYSYNASGQRTERNYTYSLPTLDTSAVAMGTLMGYTQIFRYDQSGRLVYESKSCQYYGETGSFDSIVYLYDENSIIGMVYTGASGETNTYYFQRNLLGDVIGIYDTNGTKVGEYAYDAFGNCTVTQNTNSIVTRNPIRYRGYYYDQDTRLYYLNARYYCPEWRRFISPDDTSYLDPESVNGLNLYAYCYNDPVNYADPSGHVPEWLKNLLTGVGIIVGTALFVTAIIASAGAVGALVGVGAAAIGLSTTAVSTAITIATVSTYVVAGGVGLFGASDAIEVFSGGVNPIRDYVMGGNQTAYNITNGVFNILGTIAVIAGMIGPKVLQKIAQSGGTPKVSNGKTVGYAKDFFDKKGNWNYRIDATTHGNPNAASWHHNPHYHVVTRGGDGTAVYYLWEIIKEMLKK